MSTADVSWLRRHRRLMIRLAIAVVLVVAGVIAFMPSLIAPWSRLNNEEQEMDLSSGRARFTRYVLYCQVSQEIRETPLSEVIAEGENRDDSNQRWVMVNIFQTGLRHSPHFRYHGALANANILAKLWALYQFNGDARVKSARQLLRTMREGGSYFAGGDYLGLLGDLLGPVPVGKHVTSADKIPDDLTERALTKRDE